MDIEKYYERIGPKNKNKVLDKKINREFILSTAFLITGLLEGIIFLKLIINVFIGLVKHEYLRNKPDNLISMFSMLFFGLALGAIIYSEKEPLKDLNFNDRIFAWIYYLVTKIESHKKSKFRFSISNIKLALIKNKILKYFSKIRVNLNDTFIFNYNLEKRINLIKKLESSMPKSIGLIVNDDEYKEKFVDFLNFVMDIYGRLVILDFDKDIKLDENDKIEQMCIELDKKISEIEEIKINYPKESLHINHIKEINKNYFIAFLVVIFGILLLYLLTFDKNINPLITNIGVVITICGSLLSILLNKKS